MSIKGFEVGGVQQQYDYTALDNIPANLVQDANYVHTDNNYTNADKTKLSGIEAQANKTTIDATLTHSGQAADAKATGDAISALDAQVIASMPHDTASGSIASFPDGAAMPVIDCSVAVEPYQSGSGDPAPDNVRPISGWTECKVTRTGKNLWQFANAYTATGSSTLIANQALSAPMKAGTYVLSCYGSIGNAAAFTFRDSANNALATVTLNSSALSNGRYVKSFTLPDTAVKLNLFTNNTLDINNIQVEVGTAATAFETPVTPQTYTIDLDGTRYGGTLDVTSGKLTVDRAMATLNGTQRIAWVNWRATDTSTAWQYGSEVVDAKKVATNVLPNIISDRLTAVIYNQMYTGTVSNSIAVNTNVNYSIIVRVDDTSLTTETAINAYLSANPIQIVYELATPIEVQLTPTEITTLLGTNNIFADCGDTTVDYYADTTLFVNKKIAAAVAAMS